MSKSLSLEVESPISQSEIVRLQISFLNTLWFWRIFFLCNLFLIGWMGWKKFQLWGVITWSYPGFYFSCNISLILQGLDESWSRLPIAGIKSCQLKVLERSCWLISTTHFRRGLAALKILSINRFKPINSLMNIYKILILNLNDWPSTGLSSVF